MCRNLKSLVKFSDTTESATSGSICDNMAHRQCVDHRGRPSVCVRGGVRISDVPTQTSDCFGGCMRLINNLCLYAGPGVCKNFRHGLMGQSGDVARHGHRVRRAARALRKFPLGERPRVRIPLSPPASLSLDGNLSLVAWSPPGARRCRRGERPFKVPHIEFRHQPCGNHVPPLPRIPARRAAGDLAT